MTTSISTQKTILVVAPATLEEDFTFDVTLGGKHKDRLFTVTVPKGGVTEGEEFEIPYPGTEDERSCSEGDVNSYSRSDDDDDDEEGEEKRTLPCRSSSQDMMHDDEATSETMSGAVPVTGRWRNHLLACCDVVTQATFWTALACAPVLMAQLVTRLRLTYKGEPVLPSSQKAHTSATVFGEAQEEASLSYNRIVLSFMAVLFIGNLLPFIGLALVAVYLVLATVYVGSNIRRTMRQRYKISTLPIFSTFCCRWCSRQPSVTVGKGQQQQDPNSVGGRLEDCLCMLCCGCCSLIQMARHTHNDKEYPGYCCTTSGLEADAPKVA